MTVGTYVVYRQYPNCVLDAVVGIIEHIRNDGMCGVRWFDGGSELWYYAPIALIKV